MQQIWKIIEFGGILPCRLPAKSTCGCSNAEQARGISYNAAPLPAHGRSTVL